LAKVSRDHDAGITPAISAYGFDQHNLCDAQSREPTGALGRAPSMQVIRTGAKIASTWLV
jgi:hypothetical protein